MILSGGCLVQHGEGGRDLHPRTGKANRFTELFGSLAFARAAGAVWGHLGFTAIKGALAAPNLHRRPKWSIRSRLKSHATDISFLGWFFLLSTLLKPGDVRSMSAGTLYTKGKYHADRHR
jgi:hypothetical protein